MTKANARHCFLEDVVDSLEFWKAAARDEVFQPDPRRERLLPPDALAALKGVRAALSAGGISPELWTIFVSQYLNGLAHSFLVSLDGGSHLADVAPVQVVDDSGHPLGAGLHEELYEHIDGRRAGTSGG